MKENIKVDNEMRELENKGIDNIDQSAQAAKEETMSIGGLEMVNKPHEHPMDLIVVPLPKKTN